MTLAQIIASLTKGYIKKTGRQPFGLDKLRIKMEAAEKLRQMNKIVKFPQQRSFKQEVDDMIKDGTIKMGAAPKQSDKIRTRNMFKDSNLNKTEAELKTKFDKQNKEAVERLKNKRQLTKEELEDFEMEIGSDNLEAYYFDGTLASANKIRKEQADYVAQMKMEYQKGNLDPKPGEANRERFLQKKFDEMESSGDNRLMTRDEVEELSSFGLQKDMDKSVKNFKEKDFKQKKTLKDFDPEDRDPNADGGVAGLLGERTGFRGGGRYQGGSGAPGSAKSSSRSRSSTNRGPAGGASAGGNYGGNRNPQQTYGGGNNNTGGGGGGGPSGTNTGGGGPSTTTPTFTQPTILETIKEKQILDYIRTLQEEEDSALSAGSVLGGILKKGVIKKGPLTIGEKGVGLEFLKKYNYLGDSNFKFNLDIKYKDLLKGNFKPKAGFERNIGDFKLKGDIDTDKNIGLELSMPTNFFNRNKTRSRTNFDKNRFAPDISKFNFGDRTGIISKAPTNMLMADASGPARQNFAMGKRAFLKMIAGAGAGIAGLKSGLIGFGGKEATKKAVTETVKSAGSGTPPPYFFKLVDKIKTMGDDTLATTDKTIAKKYKDYTMEEDFAGNIEIIEKGDNVAEDVYMSYKVDDVQLRGKKGSKKVEEYEEYTARPDAEGKMKDIEQGVPDEVVNEGSVFEDNLTEFGMTKKASGGIARMLGE